MEACAGSGQGNPAQPTRRPLLAQSRHPQRLDMGRGHSGHEEAPALERPDYGAEVFHEAARGRTIFASRIGMAWHGRWREEEMENSDKEENEQDPRYRGKDGHIAVSGHAGMDTYYGAPNQCLFCNHVKSALVQASSFFLFASSPFLIIVAAR